MRKVVTLVGICLLLAGIWNGVSMYRFIHSAQKVSAKVVSIEEHKGPPKPRQKTPVHISFLNNRGEMRSAITHLPMLYRVESGDQIEVLVEGADSGSVHLNLWSELWARPLTYTVGGLLLMIVSIVLSQKRWRA
jgi:hypothetical protein